MRRKAKAANGRRDIKATERTRVSPFWKPRESATETILSALAEKGEKCGQVDGEKPLCESARLVVIRDRGKPFLVQEQEFSSKDENNGRSLEPMSDHWPREMVIRLIER